MENNETEYCRLCALPKNHNKLLNLQTDRVKFEDILIKLEFVNAIYVDITNKDPLPKTVCLVCYNSLHKAYNFLKSVKYAQDALFKIFSTSKVSKSTLSGESTSVIVGEVQASQSCIEIKLEELSSAESCDNVDVSVNIKKESNVKVELGDQGAALAQVSSDDELLTDNSEKTIKSWADYTWTCSGCETDFNSLDELRLHAKAEHNKCAAFVCLDCGEDRKKDFSSFVKHVLIHRRVLRKCCYYCNTSVDTPEDLTAHLKQHFRNVQVPCELCAEILSDKTALADHLFDYKPEEPTLIPKPEPRRRRKRGIPYSTEDLTCKICKNVYKNPNSLRDHIKRHEDRKRSYVCDRCGKSFFSKGVLRMHVVTHDNHRPHVCHICKKGFRFLKKLKDHLLTHTDDKPFACDECGKGFRLKYQLNSHKIIHTDLMPFVCQYCNKAFRFKQILKNHELQHTGVKPYSCDNCGMVFTNWSNYNKHMKRKHNIDTSKKKKIIVEGNFLEVNAVLDSKGDQSRKGKKRGRTSVKREPDIDYECPVGSVHT